MSFTALTACRSRAQLPLLLKALGAAVGRTLTWSNFSQDEVFKPLGISLARQLAHIDEAQRTVTEETGKNNGGDDQPRPKVADIVLATSAATPARELLEPGDAGEQTGEIDGSGNGVVARNSQ